MSAEIHSLGAPRIDSDRKSEFLQHISASFDAYVQATGEEPQAVVHILGGVTERHSIGWHVTGSAKGCADAFLCRAEKALLREIMQAD